MSRDTRLQDRSIDPHWRTGTVRFSDQDAAGLANNAARCAHLETARREDGARGPPWRRTA